jgi:hypothetical protein
MGLHWSRSKSDELKKTRGVSFEEIILMRLVTIREHPKRLNQDMLMFELRGYIWVVPCVEQGNDIFLKTLFPSRKYTKMWRRGELS